MRTRSEPMSALLDRQRERAVLDGLLADLSPRTVEYHLAKVFAKLTITSRRQLRQALPVSGRAGPTAPVPPGTH